jgi:hypothetical protein
VGCDVPVKGSVYQGMHVDYQHPLFAEAPDLPLPFYLLVVNFGLIDITPAHGPIETAAGTHRMKRAEALDAVASGDQAGIHATRDRGRSDPASLGAALVIAKHHGNATPAGHHPLRSPLVRGQQPRGGPDPNRAVEHGCRRSSKPSCDFQQKADRCRLRVTIWLPFRHYFQLRRAELKKVKVHSDFSTLLLT